MTYNWRWRYCNFTLPWWYCIAARRYFLSYEIRILHIVVGTPRYLIIRVTCSALFKLHIIDLISFKTETCLSDYVPPFGQVNSQHTSRQPDWVSEYHLIIAKMRFIRILPVMTWLSLNSLVYSQHKRWTSNQENKRHTTMDTHNELSVKKNIV